MEEKAGSCCLGNHCNSEVKLQPLKLSTDLWKVAGGTRIDQVRNKKIRGNLEDPAAKGTIEKKGTGVVRSSRET